MLFSMEFFYVSDLIKATETWHQQRKKNVNTPRYHITIYKTLVDLFLFPYVPLTREFLSPTGPFSGQTTGP